MSLLTTRIAATTDPTVPGQSWNLSSPAAPAKLRRPARNNRRFSNAVFRVFGAGAPWRDLPPDYGDGCATHRRFSRWRAEGTWARLLDVVSGDRDLEWLMIDGSYVKAHQHGTGAVGRAEGSGLPNSIRQWMPTECQFGC